jgi:hypothetical protein
MNTVQLLREAGPEGPPLTAATRDAARAALLAEIGHEVGTARPRAARLPSRKVRWRIGVGAVAVAASWAAAVVIAAPDELGPPPDSVELVAFEPLTFPLSLDPAPPGWTLGGFDADMGFLRASYGDASGAHGAAIALSMDEPEFSDVSREEDVAVDGAEGVLVTTTSNYCDTAADGTESCELRDEVRLVFERRDDQWVTVSGPTDPDRLVALAGSLVDRPQRVPLQISLAPEGWSLQGFKDDRILTLVDDDHDQHSLSVHLPYPEDVIPPAEVRSRLMGPVGPQLDVTVNGRPAQLVRLQGDLMYEGRFLERWWLQAQFQDGTTFVVQAPESFTQEQVLQLAETVVHSP